MGGEGVNDFSKDIIAFPNITFTCGVVHIDLLLCLYCLKDFCPKYSNENGRSFSRNSSIKGTKPGIKLSH